jgi:hypothetical protein
MDIRFDEFKNELNLTLSVVLNDRLSESAKSRILEIQKRLVDAFECDLNLELVPHIVTVSELENWRFSQTGRRLYVCPWDTQHFSMLNCVRCELKDSQFQTARTEIAGTDWFESLKKFVIENALSRLRESPHTFTVRGIYTESASPSVALKVYPEDDRWLRILREFNRNLERRVDELNIREARLKENCRLKIHWDGNSYFSANVMRFLRQHCDEPLERPEYFSRITAEENNHLNRKPIVLGPVNPELVISNAYLSNPAPVLS